MSRQRQAIMRELALKESVQSNNQQTAQAASEIITSDESTDLVSEIQDAKEVDETVAETVDQPALQQPEKKRASFKKKKP